MNIKKFISEKSFVYCLIGNVLIMAFYFLFFTCHFETCDDFIMKMIAAGSFTGTPDNHLIYIGSFLGTIMSFLYSIFPHVAWYEIVQVFILWVSFSAITYVLIRKHKVFEVLIWLLVFVLSYSFYVSLQFTKTTAVPTIAGYLVIAYALNNNEKNYKLICGVVLLFFGMSLRFNQFFVCSFVSIPIFVPLLLDCLKGHKEKQNRQKLIKLIATAALAFIMMFVTIAIRNVNYGSDSWKYYLAYNDLNTELLDRGFPDYEKNEDLYKELRIDGNFLDLIKKSNFYDPDIFSEEAIGRLMAVKDRKISIGYIYEFLYVAIPHFFDNDYIRPYSIAVSVMIIVCLLGSDRKSFIAAFTTLLFMIMAVFICYYIRADHFYPRMSISFLTAAALVLAYLSRLDKYHPSFKGMTIAAAVTCAVCCCIWFDDLWINGEGARSLSEHRTEICETLAKDPDHLYIYPTLDRFWVNELLFKDISYLDFTHIESLGEWVTGAPIVSETGKRFGVVNPYRDAVNNDKAYFLVQNGDRNFDQILKHIKTNYYENAEAIVVNTIENYTVYRIISN